MKKSKPSKTRQAILAGIVDAHMQTPAMRARQDAEWTADALRRTTRHPDDTLRAEIEGRAARIANEVLSLKQSTTNRGNARHGRKGLSRNLLFIALNERAAACWEASQKPGADLVKAEVRWKTDVAARMGIKSGWSKVAPHLPKWGITEAEIVKHLETWRKPMPAQ